MDTGESAGLYTSISLNDDAADSVHTAARPSAASASAAAATAPAAAARTSRRPVSLMAPVASQQQQRQRQQQQQPEPQQLDDAEAEPDTSAAPGTFENRTELQDEYNLVYLSMVLAGIGFLLPYNSFVNAVDFYQKRFDSHLIVFDISMTYITVMLLGVFITNLLVNRVHLRWRITFGYLVAIVVLFLTTLFDIILNAFPSNWSYGLTLLSAGIVSLGCTVQQSSFYGYTSLLPRRFTQAVMLGESCAGFIVSLNRILTKYAVASAVPSTALFFILSSCMLLLCLLTFTLAVKSRYVRQFIRPTSSTDSGGDGSSGSRGPGGSAVPEDRVRMLPAGLDNPSYQAEMLDLDRLDEEATTRQPNIVATPETSAAAAATAAAGVARQPPLSGGRFYHNIDAGLQLRLSVAHSIWLYMAAIALCYLITLSLFPGIESEIPSCRLKDWMPIALMAVFNGSDLVGKLLAGLPVSWRGGPLLVCSLFRFCLVPLFMSSASPRQKPHINSESWAFFVTILLGLSNGYFGSVPMINAPKTVQSSSREIAGNLMTLSYSVGLTAGSGISYWLDDLLGPVPPKLQTWEYACGFYNVSQLLIRR